MPGSLSPSRKKSVSGPVAHDFPAKTKLFELERGSRHVYLLRSGRVRLARGREAILDYLMPSNFFGEQCLLGTKYQNQTATCLTPVQVTRYRKSQLLDLLQTDRRFLLQLLKNLSLRLNRYEETIRDSVAERAERRLARLLLRFVPVHTNAGWVRLEFSPTNSDLAKTIGTTRWRIAHFMHEFQRLGWLDRRPELWVRVEGLRDYLGSTPNLAAATDGKNTA
jgi:CRP/FNR family transcriptional regulator, cyclic AMP receptor protein